jgi:hypothetical protein
LNSYCFLGECCTAERQCVEGGEPVCCAPQEECVPPLELCCLRGHVCHDAAGHATDCCITGCCDDDGVCQPGTADRACGGADGRGGPCRDCTAEGQRCCGGVCQQCCTDAQCDDGNPCTTDRCQQGACVHEPVTPGTLCTDDGNPCTANFCDDEGECVAGALTGRRCGEDNDTPCMIHLCDEDGECLPAFLTGVACDDGQSNECTQGICDDEGACVPFPREGVACDDGDPCTEFDVCDEDGRCRGLPVVCPEGERCCEGACHACCVDAHCPAGWTCIAHVCVEPDDPDPEICAPDTCPDGCCDAFGACLDGTSDLACGGWGQPCEECGGEYPHCCDGDCWECCENAHCSDGHVCIDHGCVCPSDAPACEGGGREVCCGSGSTCCPQNPSRPTLQPPACCPASFPVCCPQNTADDGMPGACCPPGSYCCPGTTEDTGTGFKECCIDDGGTPV